MTQYGEESIILPFFAGLRDGLVVDVGAGDGEEFSNSRFLIRDHGWRGVLIEPEPAQYQSLVRLYADHDGVRTVECAVADTDGYADLYPAGTGSTLSVEWRDRGIVPYGSPVQVRTRTLKSLLENVDGAIDFLTVDCEGLDLEVLKTMDWTRHQPRLVCAESGAGRGTVHPLFDFMASVGYEFHANTRGNTFWARNA